MLSNDKHKEIVISASNTPVIRAGFSNLLFLFLIVILILVNHMLYSFNISLFLRLLFLFAICLMMLKVYNHSVSKLFLKDKSSLILVGPFSKTIFDSSEIELTEVYGIPSSMTIFIMIKKKTSVLSKFFFFVALSTSCGSYADTKKRLELLLKEIEQSKSKV